ncbi:MAG: ComEC/Rec2 family competence protein, partial [Chlamydiales bacterium]|nr:ComEC/Rec2 family competence protein [Chlamydiales bacterium]
MLTILHALQRIFQIHLIFYYAIAFACGIAYAFTDYLIIFLSYCVLSLLFIIKKWTYFLCFLTSFLLGFFLAQMHMCTLSSTLPLSGTATIEFDRICKVDDPILSKWKGIGRIIEFETEDEVSIKNTPFVMNFLKKPPINIKYQYRCDAMITHINHHVCYLKSLSTTFQKLHSTSWIKPLRRDVKQHVMKIIHERSSNTHVKALYIALLTGELNDLLLSFYFQKLGLQHLLAISGFHFGIVCLFLSFLIKKWLPRLPSTMLMICITTLYFFYLGTSPSILRAWIATLCGLTAQFLDGKVKSLNILGMGLIINLALYPLDIYHLGFQLTYSATFGIITLSAMMQQKLGNLLSPNPAHPMFVKLNKFFISALAINFSTFLTTFPIILLQFKKFPLLSFFYNLYAPFC